MLHFASVMYVALSILGLPHFFIRNVLQSSHWTQWFWHDDSCLKSPDSSVNPMYKVYYRFPLSGPCKVKMLLCSMSFWIPIPKSLTWFQNWQPHYRSSPYFQYLSFPCTCNDYQCVHCTIFSCVASKSVTVFDWDLPKRESVMLALIKMKKS